ncbi:MAG: type I-B CRISPR-associated protein Cas5b [Bacteroides sp.]|nr:type I-B CRISPR-associated protein Cas5b [Bacteroides sp.]
MKVFRIKISSWTSSFRYPNIISGFQPTLEVPPVSTVLGLMNACSGKYLMHPMLRIGYYFSYQAKSIDLETIYQIEADSKGVPKNQVKSNIIRREFLYDCRLYIYLTDEEIVGYFRCPHHQLILGRSNDLATVESVEELELKEKEDATCISGQVIPFKDHHLAGVLQALPIYFSNTIPRKPLQVEPFSIISCNDRIGKNNLKVYSDSIEDNEVDIYFHQLTFMHE